MTLLNVVPFQKHGNMQHSRTKLQVVLCTLSCAHTLGHTTIWCQVWGAAPQPAANLSPPPTKELLFSFSLLFFYVFLLFSSILLQWIFYKSVIIYINIYNLAYPIQLRIQLWLYIYVVLWSLPFNIRYRITSAWSFLIPLILHFDKLYISCYK